MIDAVDYVKKVLVFSCKESLTSQTKFFLISKFSVNLNLILRFNLYIILQLKSTILEPPKIVVFCQCRSGF